MKIGLKTTLGFVLVLVLMIIVGGIGIFALKSSSWKSMEVNANHELVTKGFEMRRDVLSAQNDTLLGRISRDKKYQTAVSKRLEHCREIVNTIKNWSQDKNFPAQLDDEFLKRLDVTDKVFVNYGKTDTEWHEANGRSHVAVTERRSRSEEAESAFAELRKHVLEISRGDEFAEKIGDKLYVSDERLVLVEEIENVILAIETLRCRAVQYDYDPYMVDEKKGQEKADIMKAADDILKRVDGIHSQLTSPIGRELCETTRQAVGSWKTQMEEVFRLDDDLTRHANKLEGIAQEALARLQTMVDDLDKMASDVQEEGKVVDAEMFYLIVTICAVALIAGLLIAFVLTKNITTGISVAVNTIEAVAGEGDLDVQFDPHFLQRKDEVGSLVRRVQRVLNDYENIAKMGRELAEGNWTISMNVKSDKDAMNKHLNRMLDEINATLNEINVSVREVATGSGEVSTASQSLSSGAQESAASLEEITASMSEISSQTKMNAESAAHARDLAQKATRAAADGQDAMKKMNESMVRITNNSEEIQRVIKVIDDIAFQTNLLALNAAVEAARAGVHGKGFAVVAEEVRNLAARSAKAAKETTDLISTSGREIEQGGKVTDQTAEVLNEIVEQIRQTTELVAGIAVASNEQAQGVAQVTLGLQQIDAVTQQNTASAEESASAAAEMSAMAGNLQTLIAKFRLR